MSEARVRTANPWPGRWVVLGGVLLLIGGLSPIHRLFAGIDLEPTKHWIEQPQWIWPWEGIPAYWSDGRYSDAFDQILPVVIGLLACATLLIRPKRARQVGRIVVATLHVALMGGYVAMVVLGAEGGWPDAGDRGERVLHPKAVTFVFSLLLAGMLAAALVRSADLASRALRVVGVVSAVGMLWLFLLNPLEFWSMPSLQGLLKVDPLDPPLMVWAWRVTVLYALLSLFHARRRMHPAFARALLWCGLIVVLLHVLGRGLDRPWLLVVREMGLRLGSWFVMAGGIALLLSGPAPASSDLEGSGASPCALAAVLLTSYPTIRGAVRSPRGGLLQRRRFGVLQTGSATRVETSPLSFCTRYGVPARAHVPGRPRRGTGA